MYIHIFYCAITKCGELWFRFKLVHDSTSREINDGNVYFSRSTDSFFFSLVDVSSFFSSLFSSSSPSFFLSSFQIFTPLIHLSFRRLPVREASKNLRKRIRAV